MFVQIHMLQSMPPGNLNRDETGQPKKCLFGGVTRGRISSQCLKRNMRHSVFFEEAFGEQLAKRTRLLPFFVAQALEQETGFPATELEGVKAGIAKYFHGKKKKNAGEEDGVSDEDGNEGDEGQDAVQPEGDSKEPGKTSQLVFFKPVFAKKIAQLLLVLRKEEPKAYGRLIGIKPKLSRKDGEAADKKLAVFASKAYEAKESLSIDVGLFGRMTTSTLVKDVEAACQVAHAISTHEMLIECDYFTAMDDLEKDSHAAFIGAEGFFNAAVYYKYLNIDTRALSKNVEGAAADQVGKAVGVMVQAAALANPTGKQNSFAAHSVPEWILIEASKVRQPVSYANAFLKPVDGDNLMHASVAAISGYCQSVAAAFAPPDTQRFLLTVGNAGNIPFPMKATKVATLAELMTAVEAAVRPSLKSHGAA